MKWIRVRWLVLFCSSVAIYLIQACTYTASDNAGPATKPSKDDPKKGETIFFSRCASCHKVNETMTGPALGGAYSSWPDKKKLYAFVRNSKEVIDYDPYARSLWLEYNQTIMPPQPDLTDDDIKAIFRYIESVAIK